MDAGDMDSMNFSSIDQEQKPRLSGTPINTTLASLGLVHAFTLITFADSHCNPPPLVEVGAGVSIHALSLT